MNTEEEKYIYWYIDMNSSTTSPAMQYQMKTPFPCKFIDVLCKIDMLTPRVTPTPRYLIHIRKYELARIICDDDSLLMSIGNMGEAAFDLKRGIMIQIPK